MTWQAHVALASGFAAMGELVLHWFPWRLILRRDLPRVAAYILGVMAFAAPFSLLLLIWFQSIGDFISPAEVVQRCLVGFWACVIAAGASVAIAYLLDHTADVITQRAELQEIENARQSAE